ncbi:MAG TPA: hypothetical protein VNA12_07430 [Mycobacteriales bacterium]|nr:hypothetical protein [Mycobacteriales bacterium]
MPIAVAMVALMLLVGTAAYAIVRIRDDGPSSAGPVATSPPSPGSPSPQPSPEPSPSPTAKSAMAQFLDSLPVGAPPTQRLVVDGQVIDPSRAADQVIRSVAFTRTIATSTRHGTLLQGHALDGGDPTYHWALVTDTSPEAVAGGSGDYGVIRVNAAETRAAYTRHDTNGTPDRPDDDVITVELATFPEMQVVARQRLSMTQPTQVSGFVGTRVLMTRGDGGDVATLIWTPGGAVRTADRAWTSTAATEPAGSWAVVNQGDGGCGILVRVGRTVPPPPSESPPCMRSPAFSADGTLVAAFEAPIQADDVPTLLRMRELPGGGVIGEMPMPGPSPLQGEITVVSPEEVLIVTSDYIAEDRMTYAVLRCIPILQRCEVAWRSDVERSFAAVSVVQP